MDENEVVDHLEVNVRDAEIIVPLPMADGNAQIWVAKVGGGMLGRAYVGKWYCQLHLFGELAHSTDELNTGMPHTHVEVAMVYADFLVNNADKGPLVEDEGGLHSALEDFAAEGEDAYLYRMKRQGI